MDSGPGVVVDEILHTDLPAVLDKQHFNHHLRKIHLSESRGEFWFGKRSVFPSVIFGRGIWGMNLRCGRGGWRGGHQLRG